MDPDRWAFANEWFLRGQTHLLKNIVRRKHNSRNNYAYHKYEDEEDDQELLMELDKLKQEQRDLDQQLAKMNKRLEATERRPQQMMAFLCKVVEDPEILPRMMMEKERTKRLNFGTEEKRRRLMISSVSSPPSSSGMAMTSSSVKSEEEEDAATLGAISSSSEINFDVDNFCQSSPSPETRSGAWFSQRQKSISRPAISQEQPYGTATATANFYNNISSSLSPVSSIGSGSFAVAPRGGNFAVYDNTYSGESGYLGGGGGGMVVGEGAASPPPYPFSLLGGGF